MQNEVLSVKGPRIRAHELEKALSMNTIAGGPQFEQKDLKTVVVDQNNHQCILVKFTVNSKDLVPPAIHKRRITEDQVRAKDVERSVRASNMGQKEVAQFSRERSQRVDTGVHVLDNVGPVQIAMLRRALASNSYYLSDAYCVEKANTQDRRKNKWVITLEFDRGSDVKELNPEVAEAIREFARMTWQFCHVWDNGSTFKTITVNVGGLQKGAQPRFAVVVRNRTLQAIPIEKPVEETEE